MVSEAKIFDAITSLTEFSSASISRAVRYTELRAAKAFVRIRPNCTRVAWFLSEGFVDSIWSATRVQTKLHKPTQSAAIAIRTALTCSRALVIPAPASPMTWLLGTRTFVKVKLAWWLPSTELKLRSNSTPGVLVSIRIIAGPTSSSSTKVFMKSAFDPPVT